MSNTKEVQEAFFIHGERTFEPLLELARSSYFAARDTERTAAARVQNLRVVEERLLSAIEAVRKIKRTLDR